MQRIRLTFPAPLAPASNGSPRAMALSNSLDLSLEIDRSARSVIINGSPLFTALKSNERRGAESFFGKLGEPEFLSTPGRGHRYFVCREKHHILRYFESSEPGVA